MTDTMKNETELLKIPVGEMMRQIRLEQGVSQSDLSRGLCAISALSHFENGIRVPNSILFFHFMKRLGKTPSNFTVMISDEEMVYYNWKWNVLNAILQGNWIETEKIYLHTSFTISKQSKSIQTQSLYYVQSVLAYRKHSNIKKALHYLEKAIECTVPKFKKNLLSDLLLSSDELKLILYYIYLADGEQQISKHEAKLIFQHLTAYVIRHFTDQMELSSVYPRLICVKLSILGQQIKSQDQILLCTKAKELLRNNHSTYDLTEIFRILLLNLEKEQNQNVEHLKKQYESFIMVLDYHHFCSSFQPESLHVDRINIYLISECLHAHRIKHKITQEATSDGICAVETFSRIETGKHRPSVRHFGLLTKRLQIKWNYYSDDIETDNYHTFEVKTALKEALLEKNIVASNLLLTKLKKMIDMDQTANIQFIGLIESWMKFYMKEISAEHLLQECERLLNITCAQISDEPCRSLVWFTQTEIYLQNCIAFALSLIGRQEDGIRLLEHLIGNFKKSKIGMRYWKLNLITYYNLSIIYFNYKNYKKSIENLLYLQKTCLFFSNEMNFSKTIHSIAICMINLQLDSTSASELLLASDSLFDFFLYK